jgi:hypothetical protein
MAWNEWERLKAAAGRGAPDGLRVHQADLRAVGHEAFLLHEGLRAAADVGGAGPDGAGATSRAAAALRTSGFATGGALATTLEVWSSQVRTVLQATAQICGHLDHSRKAHARDDAEAAAALTRRDGLPAAPVSVLATYLT